MQGTMGLSAYSSPTLTTLPSDVLCHIALLTLPDTPTPEDLQSIFCLLLTCRSFSDLFSSLHNYDFYGNVFRLMFDIDSIAERLGLQAIRSSTLTSELRFRCLLLKRIKSTLCAPAALTLPDQADSEPLFIDLTHLFLMMTEDHGKNRYQLLNLVTRGHHHTQSASARWESKAVKSLQSKTPALAYFAAILLMNESEGEDVRGENDDVRDSVLDILEPCTSYDTSFPEFYQTELTRVISWHGVSCLYTPPTLTHLARVSTIARYNVIGWTRNPNLEYAKVPHSRLQAYWKDHIRITTVSQEATHEATLTASLVSNTIQGSWIGFIVIVAPMDSPLKTFLCMQPMELTVREYASIAKEQALPSDFSDSNHVWGTHEAIPHPWFPSGSTFMETPTALYIRHPNGRLSEYQLVSNNNSNGNHTTLDTILIGETGLSHESRYGEYTFKGRVNRREGTVVFVRTPADPATTALGTWVFYGKMQDHDAGSLVGDWWAASAPQVPAARGWFHLSKRRD